MKGLKINVKVAAKLSNEHDDMILSLSNKQTKSECSKIIDNIYLSGYQCASDINYITDNKFTHIVNCAIGSKNFKTQTFADIKYLLIDLKDDPGFDLVLAIYKTIDFIETSLIEKGKILIHCFEVNIFINNLKGISRGPALLASYLMWKYKMSKDEAVKLIKEKRNCVELNLGFMVQLSKFEEHLKSNFSSNNSYLFLNITQEGNITIFDKPQTSVDVLLIKSHDIFYKIYSKNIISDSLEIFISLLQKYENFPINCVSLLVESKQINMDTFNNCNEELMKYGRDMSFFNE